MIDSWTVTHAALNGGVNGDHYIIAIDDSDGFLTASLYTSDLVHHVVYGRQCHDLQASCASGLVHHAAYRRWCFEFLSPHHTFDLLCTSWPMGDGVMIFKLLMLSVLCIARPMGSDVMIFKLLASLFLQKIDDGKRDFS